MKFPTGGTAREPKGRLGETPRPTVSLDERRSCNAGVVIPAHMDLLWNGNIPEFFVPAEHAGGSRAAKRRTCRRCLNVWFKAFFVVGRRTMEDREYMCLALAVAERGVGWVSPNPLVGA